MRVQVCWASRDAMPRGRSSFLSQNTVDITDWLLQHHPLIRTFLFFYAALSYDSLARSMHNLSMARIPSLQQAEDFYNKALATLPEPLLLQQDEKTPNSPPKSPPKLSFGLSQPQQPTTKPSLPSMWDLNSTFDSLEMSARRHSFNSSKHARTDSLVTDVTWAGNPDSDPFTDDIETASKSDNKTDTTHLSTEHPSIRRPSPLQIRKARSSDSLLSQKSVQTDSPAQTPSRASAPPGDFQFPPVTPPPKAPHGFVDLVEGTPIQWTPVQHHQANAATTPIARTHPCPRLLFPHDHSRSSTATTTSGSLLPLPLNTRIQHFNGDLSSFRGQLVAHLLAIQSLKSGGSAASSRSSSATSAATPTSSSSSTEWSEATATTAAVADDNRRRSAIMFAPETGTSGRSMTEMERAERIKRGRERAWRRERFDPSGCRELASMALQECGV